MWESSFYYRLLEWARGEEGGDDGGWEWPCVGGNSLWGGTCSLLSSSSRIRGPSCLVGAEEADWRLLVSGARLDEANSAKIRLRHSTR